MKRLEISKTANLTGHQNPVYAIAMAADGHRFYTAGNDKGVVQWNLDKPGFERVLCPLQHTAYGLHLLPGQMGLVISMRNGEVFRVDTGNGQIRQRFVLHQKPVFAIGSRARVAGGSELVIGSEDGSISVWNLEPESDSGPHTASGPVYHFKVSEFPIRCLAISPDGRWLCFGTKDGKILVLNAADYSLHQVLDAHEQVVTALCFSPDGHYLLSSGRDARFCVFRIPEFVLETDFVPHMYAVYSMQYNPVYPVFATASRDKSVKIWSAEDFRLLRAISLDKGSDAHRLSVNALTWDHSGKLLMTTGDDKVVMVWEMRFDEGNEVFDD